MAKFDNGAVLFPEETMQACQLVKGVTKSLIYPDRQHPLVISDAPSYLVDIVQNRMKREAKFGRFRLNPSRPEDHANYVKVLKAVDSIDWMPQLVTHGEVYLSARKRVSVIVRAHLNGNPASGSYNGNRIAMCDMMNMMAETCKLVAEIQKKNVIVVTRSTDDWLLTSWREGLIPIHFSEWIVAKDASDMDAHLKSPVYQEALKSMVIMLLTLVRVFCAEYKDGLATILQRYTQRASMKGVKICEAFEMVFTSKDLGEVPEFIKVNNLHKRDAYSLEESGVFDSGEMVENHKSGEEFGAMVQENERLKALDNPDM